MAFTARIPLTKGKVAIVDGADLGWLSQWKWKICSTPQGFLYAGRQEWDGQKSHHVSMARLILGLTDSSVLADHKNGNTLDNRRVNLRPATVTQSLANRKCYKNSTSGFKGVGWEKQCSKFRARLKLHGKLVHSSFHATAKEAHEAYTKAAITLHGEFARTE